MDKQAWNEGWDTFDNKKGAHSNPYDKEKENAKWYSWHTGFYDAKDHYESDIGDWFIA